MEINFFNVTLKICVCKNSLISIYLFTTQLMLCATLTVFNSGKEKPTSGGHTFTSERVMKSWLRLYQFFKKEKNSCKFRFTIFIVSAKPWDQTSYLTIYLKIKAFFWEFLFISFHVTTF